MGEGQLSAGQTVRDRLLTAAQDAILAKGFAATTIDELIAAVGLSKSGFFYHFRDKSALALALMERYIAEDQAILEALFRQGDAAHNDPLHGFLAGLENFAAMLADLPGTHPGCLAAAFVYQEQLFRRDIHELNRQGVLVWRTRFHSRLALIARHYPPHAPVDLVALADMAAALVEGGIILSRILRDPDVLPGQITLYRQFIRLVFSPDAPPRPGRNHS